MAASKSSTKTKSTTAKQKAAAKAAKEKAAAKKAEERKAALQSGALIDGKGDLEFVRVDRDSKTGELQKRARAILAELDKSKTTPVVIRDLIAKHGGHFPQYLAMFQMLEAQDLVTPYRTRGTGRGGSQVAFLAK